MDGFMHGISLAETARLQADAYSPRSFFRARRNRQAVHDEMTSEASHTDLEARLQLLWQRAEAGDEAAYRQALALIAGRLRGYFRRRLPAMPEDVEDLVQETLLAVHLQRGTYDPAFAVSAWATAIARHKLVDLWRRRGRREALHDVFDEDIENRLAFEPEDQHARRDLGRLLQALPAAQRRAIELTKLEGLSVTEASERTGVSESAIKVQVHRGLKRLSMLVKGQTE